MKGTVLMNQWIRSQYFSCQILLFKGVVCQCNFLTKNKIAPISMKRTKSINK